AGARGTGASTSSRQRIHNRGSIRCGGIDPARALHRIVERVEGAYVFGRGNSRGAARIWFREGPVLGRASAQKRASDGADRKPCGGGGVSDCASDFLDSAIRQGGIAAELVARSLREGGAHPHIRRQSRIPKSEFLERDLEILPFTLYYSVD